MNFFSIITNIFNLVGGILLYFYGIGKFKDCYFKPVYIGYLLILFGIIGFVRVFLSVEEHYLFQMFFPIISIIIISSGFAIIIKK